MKTIAILAGTAALVLGVMPVGAAGPEEADLIVRNAKIVTVDDRFSIQEAMAIRGNTIVVVGKEGDVMKTRGPQTRVLDLQGNMVMPGLIDSHVHPVDASLTEFDHPIPDIDTIDGVLKHIAERVEALDDGQWIWVAQIFITRLKEQRYPTRDELDRVAPKNPVVYRTGPDASLNSLALKLSGIDKDFKVTDGGPGHAEKDPVTGELTGILRSCTRYIKYVPSEKKPTEQDRYEHIKALFRDYNSVGITSIGEGKTYSADIELFQKLYANGELTLRIFMSHNLDTIGPIEDITNEIRRINQHPLRHGDLMLRIGGIKTVLDGGMLTGSAYMRQPWGVSKIYSIDDPEYRGVKFQEQDRLIAVVKTCVECGLQHTAHSVGDGAVHALLDCYEEVGKTMPQIRDTRPSVTHSNFMSKEAVEQMARIGAVATIQPAWLYLDAKTLTDQFGYDRLRYFQPLHSISEAGGIAGGGSDHMQKIGSLRSINFYNPFLGMWTAITRRAKNYEGRLHPEEAITREQAIRFYTMNNAFILFQEKETGSLEAGKRADFIVLDRDLLTCPLDDFKDAKVLQTYVDGRLVYEEARRRDS